MTKAEQKAYFVARANEEAKQLSNQLRARKAERIKATPYARNILLLAIGSLPKEQRDYWKQMLETQDALYPVNRRAQIYKVMLNEVKLVQ
jgi:hypothetical protein